MAKKLIKGKDDQKSQWDKIWQGNFVSRQVDKGREIYNKQWIQLLKPYLGGEFAELGCGSASMLAQLAKLNKKVTGFDYSNEALKAAKKRFSELKIKNAEFINDNVLGMKTKKKYDVVWSQGLIEHFDEPGVVIREHIKITKKGKYAIISAPHRDSLYHLWYLGTRPNFLQKLWPWTEQKFITKDLLNQWMLHYLPKHKEYQIIERPVQGYIVLIIKNI